MEVIVTRAQDAALEAAVKKIADYAHGFVLVRSDGAAELGKHERGWNNGVGCVAMQISDMDDNKEVIEALEEFAAARCAQLEATNAKLREALRQQVQTLNCIDRLILDEHITRTFPRMTIHEAIRAIEKALTPSREAD
jgi:regulator of protease activity HflC (stomatin/prohibitin superfamily)